MDQTQKSDQTMLQMRPKGAHNCIGQFATIIEKEPIVSTVGDLSRMIIRTLNC